MMLRHCITVHKIGHFESYINVFSKKLLFIFQSQMMRLLTEHRQQLCYVGCVMSAVLCDGCNKKNGEIGTGSHWSV